MPDLSLQSDTVPAGKPLHSLAPENGVPPPALQLPGEPHVGVPGSPPEIVTCTLERTSTDRSKDHAEAGVSLPAAIGKYKVVGCLGSGGMGIVYEARDPDLDRLVAIKMIRSAEYAQPHEVTRFVRERQALALLKHSNIVPIYEAGAWDHRPYFVMERLGESLRARIEFYRADARRAVALLETLARAVQYLHDQGLLHRDLKPANVLFDQAGVAYLTDFGLVKPIEHADDMTHEGGIGTPTHMAPEQTGLADSTVGPQTDVWALGVILYELLTGRLPFEGKGPSRSQQIVSDEPPRPCVLKPGLDTGLEAVILKCLEKKPEDRFASARDLADELARWLTGEPLHTRPEGWRRRTWRLVRRRPWLALAVAAVVAALIATPVVLWVRDPDRPLRALQPALAAGAPVVLVPEKGAPAWSNALLGSPKIGFDEEGYLRIETIPRGLLELARDLPCRDFRLRAKVLHLRGDKSSKAGVFFGYQALAAPHGQAHLFQCLVFNDRFDMKRGLAGAPAPVALPGNRAELDSILTVDIGKPSLRTASSGHGGVVFEPAIARNKQVWRQLEVLVQGEKVQATFAGQELKAKTVAAVEKDIQRGIATPLLDEDPALYPFLAAHPERFTRQGSLGLYVAGGVAAFSEVILEPLAQP